MGIFKKKIGGYLKKEEIQKKVKEAMTMAEEAVDGPEERKALFQALLTASLIKNNTIAEPTKKTEIVTAPTENADTPSIDLLVKKTGLSKEQLEKVFDFEATPFGLNYHSFTGATPEQQIAAAKLILFGHLMLFGRTVVPTATLRAQIDDAGIDTNNLARNLTDYNGIKLEKAGGKKTAAYRLTGPGKIEAINLLATLCA